MSIPKDLQDMEYQEKENFIEFLNTSYEEFKTIPSNMFKEQTKTETVDTTKTTEESTFKTKVVKEEIKNEKGEVQQENIKVEVKEKEKINITIDDKDKAEVRKENDNALIRKNNYIVWILGAGLTGLVGFGLFYMFTKKKY